MSAIAVLTTSWDDGTPEDLELGRLLARYGFRATFYATTGPGGTRTIEDSDLRELVALGHELGNHGRSHHPFTDLSATEMIDEVAWGEHEIGRFAESASVVAPPRGRLTRAIVDTLNGRGLAVRSAPILGTRRGPPGMIVPTAQVYPHTTARTFAHLARRRALPPIPIVIAWSRSRRVRERIGRMIEAVSAGKRSCTCGATAATSRSLGCGRMWSCCSSRRRMPDWTLPRTVNSTSQRGLRLEGTDRPQPLQASRRRGSPRANA